MGNVSFALSLFDLRCVFCPGTLADNCVKFSDGKGPQIQTHEQVSSEKNILFKADQNPSVNTGTWGHSTGTLQTGMNSSMNMKQGETTKIYGEIRAI